MARDVAGELLALAAVPSAVAFGLGLQARPLAQEGQHPVGLELEQVLGVQVLGVLERPAGQAHVRQGKRPGGLRDDTHDRMGRRCSLGGRLGCTAAQNRATSERSHEAQMGLRRLGVYHGQVTG